MRLENLRLYELGANEREAILLSFGLARHENHMRVFQERVLRYVEIYELDTAVESYFFEALNLRIAAGKGAEVLSLLDQKLAQATVPEQRALLLLYMGDLAHKLQSDPVAERCYEDILNMPKAAAFHPKALLARSIICAERGDLDDACQWLSNYLSRFPTGREWRDTAAQLLPHLRAHPGQGGVNLDAVAVFLAGHWPSDPITRDFLALTAQQMQRLGLSALAHNYYNRILLQPVPPAQTQQPGLSQEPLPAAEMLSNARCLLDLNRRTEADHILRTICSQPEPTATRSEAALLWADIAQERDQRRECERRLGLIDVRHSDTNVVWMANINRLLMRVPAATNASRATAEILATLSDPVARAHPELVHKVYQTCLEALTAQHDEAGLRAAFTTTNAVLSASDLEAFRLRIARQYLLQQNYAVAGEWLQQSSLSLSNVLAVISKNDEMVRNYR